MSDVWVFSYDCPSCGSEIRGDFGDDVTCPECGRSYETEWDYIDWVSGSMSAWIVREIEPGSS